MSIRKEIEFGEHLDVKGCLFAANDVSGFADGLERFQECRTALILAAVTGKINVHNFIRTGAVV